MDIAGRSVPQWPYSGDRDRGRFKTHRIEPAAVAESPVHGSSGRAAKSGPAANMGHPLQRLVRRPR